MVAQLKTITSVTEKGLDEIKKAIACGTSSADLTREIHSVRDAVIQSTTDTWQVMQGQLDEVQANLHNLITAVDLAVGRAELQAIQKMLSEVQSNLLQEIRTV